MRAHFMLFPAALIAAAPVQAKVLMNIDEAQRLMFPHASFTQKFMALDPAQTASVERTAGAPVHDRRLKAWRVSGASGGWFIVDQVNGKDDWITYAIALTHDGVVRQIEILECASDYDTITMPEWLAQFTGHRARDEMLDISNVSGSTLSARHLTEGVKKVLLTHSYMLKQISD